MKDETKAKAKAQAKQTNRWVVMGLRALHNGVRNLIRNIWLTTAATSVMFITLTVILFAVVINMALNDTIEERTQDFSVGLYLNDELDSTVLEDLRGNLEARDYVTTVTYVSKEEAYEIFTEIKKGDLGKNRTQNESQQRIHNSFKQKSSPEKSLHAVKELHHLLGLYPADDRRRRGRCRCASLRECFSSQQRAGAPLIEKLPVELAHGAFITGAFRW